MKIFKRISSLFFAVILFLSPLSGAAASAVTFSDVKPNDWYAETVRICVEKGYLNGTGNNLFSPNAKMTRAMFATVLYRIAQSPQVSCPNPFCDVSDNKWFTDGILWAYENGIVNGTSQTTYSPDDPITREQIATILYRIYGKTTKFPFNGVFQDMNDISEYAVRGMAFASHFNYITGYGSSLNKTLKPKANATRAEVAAILLRAEELLLENFERFLTNKRRSLIVESGISSLRDPYVLAKDGVYYLFGTGWTCCRNTSGRLDGEWIPMGVCVSDFPDDYGGHPWAPEVHEYNGRYYMFTTYYSTEINTHGCVIFSSDKPEGPYVKHSEGRITPEDVDAIDGTLYIDEVGQPWIIYATRLLGVGSAPGRMEAAKLSDDLSKIISEPIVLFLANDPDWTQNLVTDGPFIYRTESGSLLMTWSNLDASGRYCVGIVQSRSGNITGPWIHSNSLLYSADRVNGYDGGHGMIFRDFDGNLWMAIHSPNQTVEEDGRHEMPVFFPIKEENDQLVWDFSDR